MSKQINSTELASIVSKLLINPESLGQLSELQQFRGFVTDIAQVVCDYCGGEIHHHADFLDDACYIGIHGNESLPEDRGIWKDFDLEGEL